MQAARSPKSWFRDMYLSFLKKALERLDCRVHKGSTLPQERRRIKRAEIFWVNRMNDLGQFIFYS